MKTALVVLDGWGISDHDRLDAVRGAETPNFDRFSRLGSAGTLAAAGRSVGLPPEQASNSEVGHMNIGSGRVVKQAYTRVDETIDRGALGENEVIKRLMTETAEADQTLHFMGLVSEGGVHSDHRHLHALVAAAAEFGVDAVTHVFTDGRDAVPTSGRGFVSTLQNVVEEHDTGHPATVSGRYYAMDRNENWDRTRQAFDAIVHGRAGHRAESAEAAVEASYERGATDEFVEPTLIGDWEGMDDSDSVLFFNFREDRARQLVRMIADIDPEWPFETDPPAVTIATMTEYGEELPFPVVFPPPDPDNVLGKVLAREGLTQLRLAESEKYAHVTYFLNGGREMEFEGERRHIVQSPDVATYDTVPEMKAAELTDTAIELVRSDEPDVLVINYANSDMVGHTGDYGAAIEAVEAVDREFGRLTEALRAAGMDVLVTSDHGNADDMGTPEEAQTAHTANPVPFVYLSAAGGPATDDAPNGALSDGRRVRSDGSLSDIAPTILDLLGVDQPVEMTGRTLLQQSTQVARDRETIS